MLSVTPATLCVFLGLRDKYYSFHIAPKCKPATAPDTSYDTAITSNPERSRAMLDSLWHCVMFVPVWPVSVGFYIVVYVSWRYFSKLILTVFKFYPIHMNTLTEWPSGIPVKVVALKLVIRVWREKMLSRMNWRCFQQEEKYEMWDDLGVLFFCQTKGKWEWPRQPTSTLSRVYFKIEELMNWWNGQVSALWTRQTIL